MEILTVLHIGIGKFPVLVTTRVELHFTTEHMFGTEFCPLGRSRLFRKNFFPPRAHNALQPFLTDIAHVQNTTILWL